MQSYYDEIAEDMKLSQGDKNWFSSEIAGQVAKAIESLKPQGSKKIFYWLREWGILGTNIAVILALLGMTLTSAYYAFSRVAKEAAFETKTSDRLDKLEGLFAVAEAQAITDKYSSLSPEELQTHRNELRQAASNLLKASKDTPNFWPVSFQIITLLSKTNFNVEISELPEVVMDGNSHMKFIGPPGATRLPQVLLKNSISDALFERVVVRLDPSVRLTDVVFISCVIILPTEQVPAQPLQKIIRTLLASDISRVEIKAS
jgi:hypothetical protein